MNSNSESKIGVILLGGTGYGAGEILRLLVQHPDISVASVVSSSAAGEAVGDRHSHLRGFYDLRFDSELDFSKLVGFERKYLITALPHGTSGQRISQIIAEAESCDVHILDLSGDLRLSDAEQRGRFYPEASDVSSEMQARFTYGLAELSGDQLASARHISNPGCFVTAASLAVAPIVTAGLHEGKIVFDGKSGSSGAGRGPSASFHHPERQANLNAYKVLEHRHEPEIRQALGDPSGTSLQTSFAPHVVPTARGMYLTCYLDLKNAASLATLTTLYQEHYEGRCFIRLRSKPVELQDVVGSNFCDIFLAVREQQVVVVAALDNLVKGMAGQAIQNINIHSSLPEHTGLWSPALRPI